MFSKRDILTNTCRLLKNIILFILSNQLSDFDLFKMFKNKNCKKLTKGNINTIDSYCQIFWFGRKINLNKLGLLKEHLRLRKFKRNFVNQI